MDQHGHGSNHSERGATQTMELTRVAAGFVDIPQRTLKHQPRVERVHPSEELHQSAR